MIRLARRPTVWTGVALLGYLTILWFAYHKGNYCNDQERDVWIATPFMLVPFFMPLVVRDLSRIFWCCFLGIMAMEYHYFLFPHSYWRIGYMLYFEKWTAGEPIWRNLMEAIVVSVSAIALFSALYCCVGVVAAKTYRLPAKDTPSQDRADRYLPTA